MFYRSIPDLNQIILKRLHILPRDFDLVIGIPRSGMLPANLLALYLNKPFTDVHSFTNGHIYSSGERSQFFDNNANKKILVVDDSVSSGSALIKCKESLKKYENEYSISYCAIYVVPGKEKMVDYYFELVPLPRYFQWNILNHIILEKSCFDIDGVLCPDPTDDQNDDGPKYLKFITNAPPLYVPGSKIGTIVTSRLEKYRQETESWLQKNNIRYRKLVMMNLPNKEARIRAGNHGQFKAEEYKSMEYDLFVESNINQALEINRITKKPVLCTENFEMIFESESFVYNVKSGKYLPFLRNLALKIRNYIKRC
jgi:uncharacterized HAD superfamily protein/hypoxanthine phosphoribosyltransferase